MHIVGFVMSVGVVIAFLTGAQTGEVLHPSATPIPTGMSLSVSVSPSPTSTPLSSPTKIAPSPTLQPTSMPTQTQIQIPSPTVSPSPTNPSPTIQQISYTPDDLERWFSQYSSEYGIDKELLRKIAACESSFNTRSYNPAGYAGMFQFSAGTWQSARRALGRDDNPELRFNAEESIRTAAFKISRSGAGAWPSCSS